MIEIIRLKFHEMKIRIRESSSDEYFRLDDGLILSISKNKTIENLKEIYYLLVRTCNSKTVSRRPLHNAGHAVVPVWSDGPPSDHC